VAKIKK